MTIREVAETIGKYYLEKNDNDYALACEEVIKLHISNLRFNGELLEITTARPGLLIGKRAANIDNLSRFLDLHIKVIEDENPLIDLLLPREPDEYEVYLAKREICSQIERQKILDELVQENQEWGYYD